MIKNDKHPKTIQEVVDVIRKVKFKAENNNNESYTQKQNKNGGGEDQGFKSLKGYNKKMKVIVFTDIYLAVMYHQQQIEQMEEN